MGRLRLATSSVVLPRLPTPPRTTRVAGTPVRRGAVARSAAPAGRLFALALLAALAAEAADAQVRVVRRNDERLKGVTSVDVVVTGIDAAAADCRLDKPSLERAAVRLLNGPGLRATVSERASSWFYTVRVDVRSTIAAGRCATALWIGLIAHVDGIPDSDRDGPPAAWGSLLVGEMALLHDLAVVQGEPGSHASAVDASLRTQISAIGERIRLANRPAGP